MVWLDLSKAYNMVNHRLLLDKLGSLMVSPSVIYWIRKFLDSRIVRVKVEKGVSNPVPTRNAYLSPHFPHFQ